MDLYTDQERHQIIQGYLMLDGLTELLMEASRCRECHKWHAERTDLPLNALVRPLRAFKTEDEIRKYLIRIRRDHGFLRNLLSRATADEAVAQIGSAKFAIGLLPWLDRCMLFRRGTKTKLMVVGIDYKHFPVFVEQRSDHCFPLDSYRTKTNIWRKSWRMFWSGIFGQYDDDAVNAFIGQHGVYFTNSMLCFGGNDDPNKHSHEYVECCRPFIKRQIEMVKPDVLVSFGDIGAWNVANILLEHDPENQLVRKLARPERPLHEMNGIVSGGKVSDGIPVVFKGRAVKFWPLYQPARHHLHGFDGDYEVLRRMLGV